MTNLYLEGFKAEQEGIKWWVNPYESGSVEAYEWDKGHTGARRLRDATKAIWPKTSLQTKERTWN